MRHPHLCDPPLGKLRLVGGKMFSAGSQRSGEGSISELFALSSLSRVI